MTQIRIQDYYRLGSDLGSFSPRTQVSSRSGPIAIMAPVRGQEIKMTPDPDYGFAKDRLQRLYGQVFPKEAPALYSRLKAHERGKAEFARRRGTLPFASLKWMCGMIGLKNTGRNRMIVVRLKKYLKNSGLVSFISRFRPGERNADEFKTWADPGSSPQSPCPVSLVRSFFSKNPLPLQTKSGVVSVVVPGGGL